MKTYKQWEESEKDFHDFIEPLDEIDLEIYIHFSGIVVPQYCKNGLLQCGEAWDEKDGMYRYETFMENNERLYYIGILPEFKQ